MRIHREAADRLASPGKVVVVAFVPIGSKRDAEMQDRFRFE